MFVVNSGKWVCSSNISTRRRVLIQRREHAKALSQQDKMSGKTGRRRISKHDLLAKERRNELAILFNRLGIRSSDFTLLGARVTDLRPGDCEGDWFDFGNLLPDGVC